MNTKQIFRNMIWKAAGAMALLLPAAGLVSCDDDDTSGGGAYFQLEEMTASKYISNASELGFDIQPIIGDETAVVAGYVVRSNRKWTVECNSDDAEWLRIFPKAGENEGRFWVCAKDNDFTSPRSTTIVFRYADGSQTETTIAVRQLANIPYINISLAENGTPVDAIEAEHAAKSYDVTVSSNIDYFYTPDQDGWFTFTELGHGLYRLDIQAYPEGAQELERSGSIDFKGAGEFSSTTAQLPVHQSIVPYIRINPESFSPSFPGASPKPQTFTVYSNYDWTISIPEEDTWYTVSPGEGEAYKSSTVTITPEANNSDKQRSSTFTIKAGTEELPVVVAQRSNAGGPEMEGLDVPAQWIFNVARIDISKVQFEDNNAMKSASGNGTLSYTHTAPSDPNSKCARILGGTGEPYITGGWPGDEWLFSIPVKNFKAGTKVYFKGTPRTSATGHLYWRMEYNDGGEWKPATELKTATVNGQTVQYTHTVTDAYTSIDFTVTFSQGIDNGKVEFRFVCAANWQSGGAGALEAPNGGTIRWAADRDDGKSETGPTIKVVD